MALSISVPGGAVEVAQLRFDGVERTDALERFFRERAGAGFVHVEELASSMRPASELGGATSGGDAVGKQRLVATVVVDHQRAVPVVEEICGLLAGTAGAVVEQDDGRAVSGAIRKEVGAFGLAGAGIELCHRGFVGVQHGRLQQPGAQRIDQRL